VTTPPDEIRPGDELLIAVGDDSRFHKVFPVAFDGIVELPYKISLAAAGKKTISFQNEIVAKYRPYFRNTPLVEVKIQPRRKAWVEVRGRVSKPGKILVDVDSSLQDVVSRAGDFSFSQTEMNSQKPVTKMITIVRQGAELRIDYDRAIEKAQPAGTRFWAGGEIVVAAQQSPSEDFDSKPATNSIKVMGEVRQPGSFAWQPETPLLEYISMAGGPQTSANLEEIVIYRQQNNSLQEMRTNLTASGITMDAGDTLLVTAKVESKFEIALRLATGLLSVVNSVVLLSIVL
jgi:protein involved in polysaccharide export with SLBB domain